MAPVSTRCCRAISALEVQMQMAVLWERMGGCGLPVQMVMHLLRVHLKAILGQLGF